MKNELPTYDRLILKLDDALVANNEVEIICVLGELARQGHPKSFFDIGVYYEAGNENDAARLDLAFYWFKKGALEEIDNKAYFAIGRFYLYGYHVAKDYGLSNKYFEEALFLGLIDAAIMLAYSHYSQGNFINAKKYATIGAKSGYPAAYYFLYLIRKKEHHYLNAIKMWWMCISIAYRLNAENPKNPKLIFFHNISKINKLEG